jgi:hypothetical protein
LLEMSLSMASAPVILTVPSPTSSVTSTDVSSRRAAPSSPDAEPESESVADSESLRTASPGHPASVLSGTSLLALSLPSESAAAGAPP